MTYTSRLTVPSSHKMLSKSSARGGKLVWLVAVHGNMMMMRLMHGGAGLWVWGSNR
jgi:hypothetical protein